MGDGLRSWWEAVRMSLPPQNLILSNPSYVCDGSGPTGACCVLVLRRISSIWAFKCRESPGQLAAWRCQGVASVLLSLWCHRNVLLPGNILLELWQGHNSTCYLLPGVLHSTAAQGTSVHHPSPWFHHDVTSPWVHLMVFISIRYKLWLRLCSRAWPPTSNCEHP